MKPLDFKFLAAAIVAVTFFGAAGASGQIGAQKSIGGSKAGDKPAEASHSQETQVTAEKDRFSGALTVTMKPQTLVDTPEHTLTMAAEVKLDGKRWGDDSLEDKTVIFEFVSKSEKRIDFGDEELHFLVDGKPVKGGQTVNVRPLPGSRDKRFGGGVALSKLEQIVRGKTVEMRLGTIELKLDESLVSLLRDFVRATQTK